VFLTLDGDGTVVDIWSPGEIRKGGVVLQGDFADPERGGVAEPGDLHDLRLGVAAPSSSLGARDAMPSQKRLWNERLCSTKLGEGELIESVMSISPGFSENLSFESFD